MALAAQTQKSGVGPYTENLLQHLNYLLASIHPRLLNVLRRSHNLSINYNSLRSLLCTRVTARWSCFCHFWVIIDSDIRRFHVYKSLWTPEIGKELSTVQETSNTHDHFVPAEIPKVCCFFLRHGGTIKCRVSTDRHHRLPLEQGGLEVACKLIFVDDQKLLKKLKKIVLHAHTNNYYNICLGLLRPTQSWNKDRS